MYLAVELLGHKVYICSALVDTAKQFSKCFYQLIIPTSIARVSEEFSFVLIWTQYLFQTSQNMPEAQGHLIIGGFKS